jgi:hypothetical protein
VDLVGKGNHIFAAFVALNPPNVRNRGFDSSFIQEALECRSFLYQLRSDKTGTRGANYVTREEAYSRADIAGVPSILCSEHSSKESPVLGILAGFGLKSGREAET